MGIKITGLRAVRFSLENMYRRTNRAALVQMRKGASAIVALAKARAPVDKGNLTRAINADEENRGGRNGRTVIIVGIDEDKVVADRPGKRVGDYALARHEGVYALGEKSKAKKAANGEPVGRKFLESAADDLEDSIARAVEKAILDAL